MGGGHLPLSGTIVVALEHSVAGPLCTRILGDLGATVVKVERPGGDFARHWDDHVAGEGAQFWWLNRNKESVVLDLREPDQRARFDELLGGADVFVHNLSPRAADGLGLTGAEFDERHRRLVHCQISGYGHDGPSRDRKAYDMLVQGEAGFMSLTGTPEQACRVGVSICDVSTGIYAAMLVLAALRERDRPGRRPSPRRRDARRRDRVLRADAAELRQRRRDLSAARRSAPRDRALRRVRDRRRSARS